MRGLDEIQKINENPRAFRGEEHFGGVHREHEAQRFHGERVEARQAERAWVKGKDDAPDPWDGTSSHARVQNAEYERSPGSGGRPNRKPDVSRALDELLFVALVADLLASGKRKQPEVQDRIHSAIDAEPPFFKFWQKLNERLLSTGQPEAGYKTAREAFNGGPTPFGALTFIGKDWDGLRAVPAPGINGQKVYHGEFREVTVRGTVWRVVANASGSSIAYASPEAALNGASAAKKHSES